MPLEDQTEPAEGDDSRLPVDEGEAVEQGSEPQDEVEAEALEPLGVELEHLTDDPPKPQSTPYIPTQHSSQPLYDDPSDSDDGEGEWITPSNVALHKSRALDLLPDASAKGKKKDQLIDAGCMTADFAMQNVLLQMGLNLVGTEGKRIERVKSWVLRCHACFK